MNRPCIRDTYYYLYRMAGAVLGIYAKSKQEAIYPIYSIDADGRKLDGAIRYTLRFGGGRGKFTAK